MSPKYFSILLQSFCDSSSNQIRALWSRSSGLKYTAATRHWNRSFKFSLLFHLLLYAYILFGQFRLIIVLKVLLNDGQAEPFLQYDILASFALYKTKLANTLSISVAIPFMFFHIYFDYIANLKTYNHIWGLVHDFMIHNPIDFFKLNPGLAPKVSALKPIESGINCLRLLGWFARKPPVALKAAIFTHRHLKWSTPNLTSTVRAQGVILHYALQIYTTFSLASANFLSVTIISLFLTFQLIPYAAGLPAFGLLAYGLLLLDALVIAYIFYLNMQILLFLVHALVLMQFISSQQVRQNNRMLNGLARRLSAGRISLQQFAVNMSVYRRIHLLALEDILHSNEYIVSGLAFIGGLTNFIANIYLVSAVVSLPFRSFEGLLLCVMLGIQGFLTLTFFRPMLALVAGMYLPGSLFYKAVRSLNTRETLLLKLQYSKQYELVASDETVHFTFGSLGKITNSTVFEFTLFYIAQVLFVLSTFHEQFLEWSE